MDDTSNKAILPIPGPALDFRQVVCPGDGTGSNSPLDQVGSRIHGNTNRTKRSKPPNRLNDVELALGGIPSILLLPQRRETPIWEDTRSEFPRKDRPVDRIDGLFGIVDERENLLLANVDVHKTLRVALTLRSRRLIIRINRLKVELLHRRESKSLKMLGAHRWHGALPPGDSATARGNLQRHNLFVGIVVHVLDPCLQATWVLTVVFQGNPDLRRMRAFLYGHAKEGDLLLDEVDLEGGDASSASILAVQI
ncbi:hypothetical protein HG530_007738 [Fusarium avenaceum]|nr:hypothetical protein HG530_007738 [Fusarium avenaceum]